MNCCSISSVAATLKPARNLRHLSLIASAMRSVLAPQLVLHHLAHCWIVMHPPVHGCSCAVSMFVACTGFNRTGFVVCSYLIQACGLSVEAALASFAAARPPGVKHEQFVAELHSRYPAASSKSSPGRISEFVFQRNWACFGLCGGPVL